MWRRADEFQLFCGYWLSAEPDIQDPPLISILLCPGSVPGGLGLVAQVFTLYHLHRVSSAVTIGSPIVQIYSQVADLGSACKLAPQSPGLPQTERLSMRVLKSILKLREVSSLSMRTIYSFPKRSSDQTYVNKHQQT